MSTKGKLAGKVALITGGTSGIGEATARLFALEGASVAFTGRRVEKGQQVAAEIKASGGQALYIPADHTKEADCRKAVQEVIQHFGRLDILFNNAGVVLHGNAEQTSEADWQLTLDLNITAVWRMSRLAIPQMRLQGGGVIVNNASDWGVGGSRTSAGILHEQGRGDPDDQGDGARPRPREYPRQCRLPRRHLRGALGGEWLFQRFRSRRARASTKRER